MKVPNQSFKNTKEVQTKHEMVTSTSANSTSSSSGFNSAASKESNNKKSGKKKNSKQSNSTDKEYRRSTARSSVISFNLGSQYFDNFGGIKMFKNSEYRDSSEDEEVDLYKNFEKLNSRNNKQPLKFLKTKIFAAGLKRRQKNDQVYNFQKDEETPDDDKSPQICGWQEIEYQPIDQRYLSGSLTRRFCQDDIDIQKSKISPMTESCHDVTFLTLRPKRNKLQKSMVYKENGWTMGSFPKNVPTPRVPK